VVFALHQGGRLAADRRDEAAAQDADARPTAKPTPTPTPTPAAINPLAFLALLLALVPTLRRIRPRI